MVKKILLLSIIVFILVVVFSSTDAREEEVLFWEFQSIDTMKFSRDVAREKLNDHSFDYVIDTQVKNIAQTGATHVAIATPYDEEFLPYLARWVEATRRYNLKIWYRGNFSGWERWFGYESINRQKHIEKTKLFIHNNPDLFENGDVFSACPECENGGPGDPRFNGDVKGHRDFIIEEYKVTKQAFKEINKNVRSNFASMNGDVARLIMDKKTTSRMDGVVVIDHYVATVEKLAQDIKDISKQSGGDIILGEFGAPILDIHGNMSHEEQKEWIKTALIKLVSLPELIGISYWVNVGGSTELWDGKGNPRKAVAAITSVYSPYQIIGIIKDELGNPIKNVMVYTSNRRYITKKDGYFFLPSVNQSSRVTAEVSGFIPVETTINEGKTTNLFLAKEHESMTFKIGKILRKIIPLP